MLRRNAPGEQVAIGHRQRPAIAVASRTRVGAGAVRPDPEAHAIEAADRPAPRRDRVDLHHRRADSHSRNQIVVAQFEPPGIMRHVGRGAAHVEADQALASCGALAATIPTTPPAGPDRMHPCREGMGVGQPAVDCMNWIGASPSPAADSIDVARRTGTDSRRPRSCRLARSLDQGATSC